MAYVGAMAEVAKIEQTSHVTRPYGTPRVAWRVALLSIAGFWAFYFVLNTLHAAIEGGPYQPAMMGKRAVVVLLGMALTFMALLVLRRLEGRALPVLIATAFLTATPLAVGYAALNYTAFYIVDPLPDEMQQMHDHADRPSDVIAEKAISWYFFVVAW